MSFEVIMNALKSNTVNVKDLIDVALADPKLGVVNLMILRCLLHIIVQRSDLEHCLVQFQDIQINNNKYRANDLLHLSQFKNGKLLVDETNKILPIFKIKYIKSDLVNKNGIIDILNNIIDFVSDFVDSKDLCNEIISTILINIEDAENSFEKDRLELLEERKKENENDSVQQDLKCIINKIIQSVYDQNDPFIRISEIDEFVKKTIEIEIHKLNEEISTSISENMRILEANQNFLRQKIEQGKSKTYAKEAVQDLSKRQNSNFTQLYNDSSDDGHIESIRKSILLSSNDNGMDLINTNDRDSRMHIPICLKDGEQTKRNAEIQVSIHSESSLEASIVDIPVKTKEQIFIQKVRPSRFCGGKHTIINKTKNNLLKKGLNDQYIENIVNKIRQNLRSQLMQNEGKQQPNKCCRCMHKKNLFALLGKPIF